MHVDITVQNPSIMGTTVFGRHELASACDRSLINRWECLLKVGHTLILPNPRDA